ncbi:hypothetical protein D3C76_1145100 [compost metagenome]
MLDLEINPPIGEASGHEFEQTPKGLVVFYRAGKERQGLWTQPIASGRNGTHRYRARDARRGVRRNTLRDHPGHRVADHVEARPTELVGEPEAIGGNFLYCKFTSQFNGLPVATHINENIGKRVAVKTGHDGIVAGMVAQPVMHDQHVSGAIAVPHIP